ncbi:hypothetical protein FOA43_004106 [Brettanomyces nanus]|uniref:Peptidase A1 domain-containing protein n=1 Tax=Eeniella nana TaxID=13502 RepID=A0A875SA90_EENNA|nr:uncharacterized protein FOA43_004106 [Brettanomyces nanus]QPG76712.1 hypothetical protein FOA43_004106 [Brettanomyces nanus]
MKEGSSHSSLEKRDIELGLSRYSYTVSGSIVGDTTVIPFLVDTSHPVTWASNSILSSLTCSGESFTVSNAYGTTAEGTMCSQNLNLGDSITLTDFPIGLATSNGFSNTAMLGLGLESNGSNSFIDDLVDQGYIEQRIASLYLNHIDLEGQLILGGINSSLYEGTIQYVDAVSSSSSGGWNINLDGISDTLGNVIDQSSGVALLDSSSTLNYFPSDVIESIASIFNGTYDDSIGMYQVNCESISTTTQQVNFHFDSSIEISAAASNMYMTFGDSCYLSMYPSTSENPYVLGQPFLANSYTVFRYDTQEVGLVQVDSGSNEVTICSFCDAQYTCVPCENITQVTTIVSTSYTTWYSTETITFSESSSTETTTSTSSSSSSAETTSSTLSSSVSSSSTSSSTSSSSVSSTEATTSMGSSSSSGSTTSSTLSSSVSSVTPSSTTSSTFSSSSSSISASTSSESIIGSSSLSSSTTSSAILSSSTPGTASSTSSATSSITSSISIPTSISSSALECSNIDESGGCYSETSSFPSSSLSSDITSSSELTQLTSSDFETTTVIRTSCSGLEGCTLSITQSISGSTSDIFSLGSSTSESSTVESSTLESSIVESPTLEYSTAESPTVESSTTEGTAESSIPESSESILVTSFGSSLLPTSQSSEVLGSSPTNTITTTLVANQSGSTSQSSTYTIESSLSQSTPVIVTTFIGEAIVVNPDACSFFHMLAVFAGTLILL